MKNGILIGCHHEFKLNELKFMCKVLKISLKKLINIWSIIRPF